MRAFGLLTSVRQASTTSPRLCGGTFVAIPTAIPVAPLMRKLGTGAGSTTGSKSWPSYVGRNGTVSWRISRRRSAPSGRSRASV